MYKISKMVWASKTTIAKITAKITTTALLFFLALFTLTTNLKAQETQEGQAGQQKEQQAKKGGWFVGFTPYLLGLSEQKSSSTIVSLLLQVAQWIAVQNLNLLR